MLSDVSLNDGINCTIGHVGSTFCGPIKTWAHKCCEPYKYLGPNIFWALKGMSFCDFGALLFLARGVYAIAQCMCDPGLHYLNNGSLLTAR